MARASRNMFTVYHLMEARGVFSENPANEDSHDPVEGTGLYKGPVPYPKMLYHPLGETRITNPGEVIIDPIQGAMKVGVQREIIFELAHNEDDEKRLREAGWHDHPAKAIAASGKEAPPISTQQRIDDLQAQLEKANAALAEAKSAVARAAPAETAARR